MKTELRSVDIQFNNAGLQQDAPMAGMTLDQWKLEINLNAGAYA